jgi:hypothetical protein
MHQCIFYLAPSDVHYSLFWNQPPAFAFNLTVLSVSLHVKNSNVKIQTDDLQTFDALEKDVKKIAAAMKLFLKQGKGKVMQELVTLSEDNNT